MLPINLELKSDLTPLVESSNKALKPISEGLAGMFVYAFQKSRQHNVISEKENSKPMEDIYKYDEAYSESLKIENAILFLLSKNLIQENPAYACHQFIPSIKKFVFDTDKQAQQLMKENEFTTS
ncbi:hypothetical protein [Streptococcus hyointestinalis]|uniref:hypothetical protein n=1 Tax=Streptococcus hyointestinalis TaxID=1337 RepID=UPI003D0713FC